MSKKDGDKKPFYKKVWFWVAAIIVICGVAAAANNSEPKKVGENSTSDNAQTEFMVGDTISYKGVETTVAKVTRNYSTGSEYFKPKDGKEYVKIDISIENKSSDRTSYNALEWEIEDSDGAIENYADAMFAQADDNLDSGDLAAGGKKKGSIVFEVPKDDKNLTVHYKPSFWSNKDIKIKL